MKPQLVVLATLAFTVAPRILAEECAKSVSTLTRQADVVVIAEITKIGKPPGIWSGILEVQQSVTYQAVKALKGELSVTNFDVDYDIVSGSRLTERNTPELNHALFKTGDSVILFLIVRKVRLPNGQQSWLFKPLDSNCSVLPMSNITIASIQHQANR